MRDVPATAITTASSIAPELGCRQDRSERSTSEIIAPRDLLAALGPVLANKCAEGFAARRYYGRCESVDVIETVAIDRPRPLLDAGFGNVQPLSTEVQ
jgi:glycine/serine hydroxymethyltransferase